MLVRTVHHHLATWKLWGTLALAIVLGLLLAQSLGAADPGRFPPSPRPLPVEIEALAKPMPEQESATLADTADLGCEIWRILELHRLEKHQAAIEAWTNLTVPQEVSVWKWLALSEAATATGQFSQAEQFCQRAIDIRPDHALVYYFRGVLRLQQASIAVDWPEEATHSSTRLVSTKSPDVVPNTKAMYELAAAMDLEMAIQLASTIHLDELLIPNTVHTMSALEPTVGDLALALGAENYVAKAHNVLSELFLKQGSLELAEQHMDDAVRGGLAVVYGYRDLGKQYRARGQHGDAARAFLKATTASSHKMHMLFEALQSLGDTVK